MPEYRGITVQLHSQFDIETFPEYYPRDQAYYDRRGITGRAPLFIDPETSTCSVYVPVFAGSQFWISYVIVPPVPDEQFFYFKLHINGTPIVSWSCGKSEGWKGKTVFGLYEGKPGMDGKRRVEKRVLCFTPSGGDDRNWKDVADPFDADAFMEIRVYRAHGRKRIERTFEEYASTPHGASGRGIHLVNAGKAGQEHPKRFYKFALIDPLHRPYMAFRYYYRTWMQLEKLGIVDEEGEVPSESEYSHDHHQEAEGQAEDGGNESDDLDDIFAAYSLSDIREEPASTRPSIDLTEPAPASPPALGLMAKVGQAVCLRRFSPRSKANRLSIPPSLKLPPPDFSLRPLPAIPQKKDGVSSQSTKDDPHPTDEWRTRTPSPVKVAREELSTPPLQRKKVFSLPGAVSNAWKRHSNSSVETSNETRARLGSCVTSSEY